MSLKRIGSFGRSKGCISPISSGKEMRWVIRVMSHKCNAAQAWVTRQVRNQPWLGQLSLESVGTLFFLISPALHIMNNAWSATLSQWCRCVPVISCCWITRKMHFYSNSTSTHIFLAQCSEWHEIYKTSDGEVSWSVQCPSAPSACQASRSPVPRGCDPKVCLTSLTLSQRNSLFSRTTFDQHKA